MLVARGPAAHRLIVGVDGSPSAHWAIATLSRWPIFAGLPARVVAVAQPPAGWAVSVGAAFYPAWVELRDSTVEVRRGHLEQVAERACEDLAGVGLKASSELREGDPADELLRAAAEDHADLIVVGSRGLSALTRLALGSVAREVLLHNGASVLVVREPREKVKAADPMPIMAVSAAGVI